MTQLIRNNAKRNTINERTRTAFHFIEQFIPCSLLLITWEFEFIFV